MSIFRLIVGVEEDDNLLLEIDIKNDQFFSDLDRAITKFFAIRGHKESAFFVSNARWQKVNETYDIE